MSEFSAAPTDQHAEFSLRHPEGTSAKATRVIGRPAHSGRSRMENEAGELSVAPFGRGQQNSASAGAAHTPRHHPNNITD